MIITKFVTTNHCSILGSIEWNWTRRLWWEQSSEIILSVELLRKKTNSCIRGMQDTVTYPENSNVTWWRLIMSTWVCLARKLTLWSIPKLWCSPLSKCLAYPLSKKLINKWQGLRVCMMERTNMGTSCK